MKSFLIISFILLLWSYIFLCSYLYLNQKSMIYFPNKEFFEKCIWFDDYKKENYNGARFYLKEKSKNIIIVYHGNAGTACDKSYLKDLLEKTNDSIMFVEYSWYSGDNKTPSINLILNDVKNINNYLKENKYEKIIVYGRSLWTWPASYQSYISKVDKLILITPFTTFIDLVKIQYPIFPITFLLTEKYNNQEWLKNYKNEILIIHGDKDEVISYNLWKKLYNNLENTKKDFLTINWKWHNNLDDENIFFEKIYNFIK